MTEYPLILVCTKCDEKIIKYGPDSPWHHYDMHKPAPPPEAEVGDR